MHRTAILASLLILLLAACGGAPAASPPPTNPPDEAATPTAESETISAEPLAVDVSGLDTGTFTATFSGRYDFTMTGPAVVAALPSGFSLSLAGASASAGDMPAGSTLVLLLPADIAPGTYVITMPFSEAQASGGLAAHYTHRGATAGSQPTPEAYGTVKTGRITIESVSPLTGAFEVTLDGGGEDIIVTGAVHQAVLLSSGA